MCDVDALYSTAQMYGTVAFWSDTVASLHLHQDGFAHKDRHDELLYWCVVRQAGRAFHFGLADDAAICSSRQLSAVTEQDVNLFGTSISDGRAASLSLLFGWPIGLGQFSA
jgi:hypothetical protein